MRLRAHSWRPRNLFESPPFWMYIAGFLLVLGPLITVHELGHYLVGRWFGVGAEAIVAFRTHDTRNPDKESNI